MVGEKQRRDSVTLSHKCCHYLKNRKPSVVEMFLNILNFIIWIIAPVAIYLLWEWVRSLKKRLKASKCENQELNDELKACHQVISRDNAILTRVKKALEAKLEESCRST